MPQKPLSPALLLTKKIEITRHTEGLVEVIFIGSMGGHPARSPVMLSASDAHYLGLALTPVEALHVA